jgi:hydrogenase maturation protein HypF
MTGEDMRTVAAARSIRVRGVVQGVGFRPFVYRLAKAKALAGWVLNEEGGVAIHLEGAEAELETFIRELAKDAPPSASIAAIEVEPSTSLGLSDFVIRESRRNGRPTVRISPDLPVCDDCLRELRHPADPRYGYPYINCANCGPRYSVVERLPYDRRNTTVKHWPMDALCEAQYGDPADRRFHAQPVACPKCGPHYRLEFPGAVLHGDKTSITAAARMLSDGKIVAVKGVGGYHLACDARNRGAVRSLRERKFRKEKPFAVMVGNIDAARQLACLSAEAEALLASPARPIVLAPKRIELEDVAPENPELGLMLPYAPLHHLLFDAGAPDALVMTSGNRSSEPIAYCDQAAREMLAGLADALLIGERPIARRVEDSVARAGALGPMVLRRSRGYAPGAAALLPARRPILAVGADLKNTVTLVAGGQAFVSQHIGDLDDYESRKAFEQVIADLMDMYEVDGEELVVAHDLHPQYASTMYAARLRAFRTIAVQHHRAHIASVLAEKQAWDERVIGVSFDGTGYGDDATIWGGEFFAGSIASGFDRVAHLRAAKLPGGDAAARNPVQCAAGFLAQIDALPDLRRPPFSFPERYGRAMQLLERNVRAFDATSMGRLFDAAAALLGFTREITFEGQAAIWLEHMARRSDEVAPYPFPFVGNELDFRPLLEAVARDRARRRDAAAIARAFQGGVARGMCSAVRELSDTYGAGTVVLSGGVFQNELLLEDVKRLLAADPIRVWTNASTPPNDGGISLGQAAIAAAGLAGA